MSSAVRRRLSGWLSGIFETTNDENDEYAVHHGNED